MNASALPGCNTRVAIEAAGEAVIAVRAAVSAVVQRRRGAREPARVLYYRAHSLLRALRLHLQSMPGAPRAA